MPAHLEQIRSWLDDRIGLTDLAAIARKKEIPVHRHSARMILEADGFAVIGEAEDGAAALTAIEELRPDLVLLDIQLPDMDGFAVLEQLGSNAPSVVLVSSRDACDYDGLIRKSRASGFIAKAELSGTAVRSLLR